MSLVCRRGAEKKTNLQSSNLFAVRTGSKVCSLVPNVLNILVPHLCHTRLDPSDFSKLGIQGCLAQSDQGYGSQMKK